MPLQVRANYDFDAQPGSGELTIRAGEVLTVIRQGIEGGWMEGQNAKGKIGLFPESYVSTVPLPPMVQQPPLPVVTPVAAYSEPPSHSLPSHRPKCANDPWDNLTSAIIPPSYIPPSANVNVPKQRLTSETGKSAQSAPTASNLYPHVASVGQLSGNDHDFDDEWSDDDDDRGQTSTAALQSSANEAATTAYNTENVRSVSVAETNSSHVTLLSAHANKGMLGAGPIANNSRTTSESRTDVSDANDDSADESTVVNESGNRAFSESCSNIDASTTKEFGSDATSQQFGKMALSGKSSNAGDSTSMIAASGRQTGTSKMKTINRFSNFVKTGMESFILAGSRLNTQPNEHYEIVFNNNQIEWKPPVQQYTCIVNKPKKESKLKGLKSFIAYSLTFSLSGIQVSRRYKHFDWLHEQLADKYLLIPIPPLPEKQVSGRYEDDLIEHRKSILQLWVNKICRHPVLSQSEVWKHFITCTDTAKWKAGKRAAEKDEYVGGNFFHCIAVPQQPLLYDLKQINNIDQQVDNYAKSVRSMDESIRELFDRVTDTQKRLIGPYKSNWQKMAAAFDSLDRSLELDQARPENPVKNALKTSAHILHKIGAEHEEHGKKGLEPTIDYLYTYKGLYANIPDIVNVYKSALSKMRDIKMEGRLPPADAEAVRERVDATTYAMMAEISHLNQERDNDFRQMFGEFFTQQAAFYTQMGKQMAELADLFQRAV